MVSDIIDFLDAETARRYAESDLPALIDQRERFARTQPLKGLKVLDASPLFYNTFPKYAALLAAGACLEIATPLAAGRDAAAAGDLLAAGLTVYDALPPCDDYDIILDNAAACAQMHPRLGASELTRTGAHGYAAARIPVYLADAGRIKRIETSLGTGDGFARAMAFLGHGDFNGKNLILFGCGKVGRGIALAAQRRGARVKAVDEAARVVPPEGVALVDMRDDAAVADVLKTAWCVVCATGIGGALAQKPWLGALAAGKALLANMGVADEFGKAVPADRVLYQKRPLNFILPEPTRLRYIEATLALHNEGAAALAAGTVNVGLQEPPADTEDAILRVVRERGRIADEMAAAGFF